MVFSLNWCNPPQELLPDQIERVTMGGIDPETVTARNLAGEVVSRFRDDSWDCRAYGQKSTFNFATWWDESKRGSMNRRARILTDEIKLIHWLLQNNTTANGGRSRGQATLREVMSPLKGIVKIAYRLALTLEEAEHYSDFQVALKTSITTSAVGFNNHDV